MVSVGSGLNNSYLQKSLLKKQLQTKEAEKNQGDEKTDGAKQKAPVKNAPANDVSGTSDIPAKKTTCFYQRKQHITEQAAGCCAPFRSIEEVENYLNYYKTVVLPNSAVHEKLPECVDFRSTHDIKYGSYPGQFIEDKNGNRITIKNLQLENITISIVKIDEVIGNDGVKYYHPTFTVDYDVTYDVEMVEDWKAGDTYTKEDGSIWEYLSDGSWIDITNIRAFMNDRSNDRYIRNGNTSSGNNNQDYQLLDNSAYLLYHNIKISSNQDILQNTRKK